MAIFNPGLLNTFERLSTGEMPDTFRVLRKPPSASDALGASKSGGPAVEVASGNCRIRALGTPEERELAMQLKQVDAEVLVMPKETDVRETDLVEVTVARTGKTAVHSIAGLFPLGSFAVHRKAIVRRG